MYFLGNSGEDHLNRPPFLHGHLSRCFFDLENNSK